MAANVRLPHAEDEAGTHARLKGHRAEFVDPTIAEFQGRIVKLMGDGALVEFPNVVDAVECAGSAATNIWRPHAVGVRAGFFGAAMPSILALIITG